MITLFDAAAGLGPVTAVVNNAAITGNTPGRLDEQDVSVVRRVLDVNVTGVFLCCREAVRVDAVAPGLVETGLHAAAGLPDRIGRLAPSIPLARAGRPEEIAEAVLWMLSPAASYAAGAVLPVGGGR